MPWPASPRDAPAGSGWWAASTRPDTATRCARAVFLDFDGTLAPIVDRPELAGIDPPTRNAVERLARRCTVAVVSGRDVDDVRARDGIKGIYYAGSHGFDIVGPGGLHQEHD